MNAKEPQPLAELVSKDGCNGGIQKNGRNKPAVAVKKPVTLPPPPPPPMAKSG